MKDESTNLLKLTSLILQHNIIGDAGVLALAESRYMAGLTFLNLSINDIGEEGAIAIEASFPYIRMARGALLNIFQSL